MQLARASCIENPEFLAALGALILDDGDAEQALIWLERALLLDPDNRGAQADHALALAQMGEPDALREIIRSWRGRTDLPVALRNKLFPPDPRNSFAFPAVRFGQPPPQTWAVQGEISAVLGHENNLDRSPRLSELTLTIPDGPFVLPVVSQPRSGAARIASAAVQLAYAPSVSSVVRTGLNITGRDAAGNHGTDWNQLQWASSASYHWPWARAQIENSASWVGGPLSEPYRLIRSSVSAEAAFLACRLRAGYERERRKQSRTTNFNSDAEGWSGSLQCPVPETATWSVALSGRDGRDAPDSIDRPGGRQHLRSSGLRVAGTMVNGIRVDASVRLSKVQDATGYSVLLSDDAQRHLVLRQISLELARSLGGYGWPGVEAVAQVQSARQTSNLQLFVYRADSFYGGLRWSW
jgi:hypothetical protein